MTEPQTDDLPEVLSFAMDEFGARLRQIRTMRKMSLAELSRASRVSVAMLSHIERGQTMPSLTTLQRVGGALGVPLSELFVEMSGQKADQRSVIMRKDDRLRIQFAHPGLSKELLSPSRTSDLEMLMLVLEPKATSGPDAWMRNGEKAGMVVEGRFELTIGTSVFELDAGDSFQFDGTIPHRFRNIYAGQTRVYWIIRSESI
ncbi:helix-turn-helix domain-containing protein [Pseudoxanthobacter sp. M-2]|uniref:helix-turn-helix domain-containing protein n=1 Tax=Pseudoxanthobacter sp. M-2 TaxID=3078754 RepID=UPI0038FCDB11